MKLSVKLFGGFVVVAMLVATVGSVGILGLKKVGNAADVILDEKVPVADASMEGMIALISGRDIMGEYLLSHDLATLDETQKEFEDTSANFDKYTQFIENNSNREIGNLVKEADQYHAIFEENAVELMKHHRLFLTAEIEVGEYMADFDSHVAQLKSLLENYESELTNGNEIDKRVDAAMEAKTIMVQQQAIAEEYMSIKDISDTDELRKEFTSLMQEFDEHEPLLPKNVVSEHDDFVELAIGPEKMFDHKDESLRMIMETRSHMVLVDEYSEKGDVLMDKVEEAAAFDMSEAMKSADAAQTSSKLLMTILTIVAFCVAILFGFFLGRSITVPINNTVNWLNSGAEQVSAASGQVSATSQSLAEGASEQAAALEETSASMEQMYSMTKQTAENATQANSLMSEALNVINTADSAMDEMSVSMEEISAASEETSRIVKTIDEIAFQTNLLALNAAVEAARAGEAGAGFAVVADEVRNLAMRAADAAKNTAELIEGTVAKVSIGKEIVTRTNSSFKEVAESSTKVGSLVAEISAAAKEQSSGFGQINEAISQMDAVTQQSAASAEESAAASEELNAQAESMMDEVTNLKNIVDGDKVAKSSGQPLTDRQKKSLLPQATPPIQAVATGAQPVKTAQVKQENISPVDDDDAFEDF